MPAEERFGFSSTSATFHHHFSYLFYSLSQADHVHVRCCSPVVVDYNNLTCLLR